MSSKRGPRTTGEDTRSQIVAAAQIEFANTGYDHASLRAIARAAAVDPALVHHYFANKSELFLRCMDEMPPHPLEIAQRVMAETPEQAPEAMLRYFIEEWDSPSGRRRFLATFRSMAQPEGLEQVRKYWRNSIIDPVVGHFADDDIQLRSNLIAAQLVGLATMRYLMRAPGLTALPARELAQMMAPCARRYLTEPLGVAVG